MARNRFLWNFLGILAGVGALVAAFLINKYAVASFDWGPITVWSIGGLVATLLLNFFAYKRDGMKITGIVCAFVVIGGVLIGILMLVTGGEIFGAMGEDLLTTILGPALFAMVLVFGIVLIVGSILGSGILIGVAAIGSAIGESVWKDKQAEQVSSYTPGGTYQTIRPEDYQTTQQPVQPRSSSVVCPNCGISNISTDKFCTNCGAKLN
ncbi:MAG: zinc-ribbon domain-containing protein [Candidatus Heimdallarchaeota archaeon]